MLKRKIHAQNNVFSCLFLHHTQKYADERLFLSSNKRPEQVEEEYKNANSSKDGDTSSIQRTTGYKNDFDEGKGRSRIALRPIASPPKKCGQNIWANVWSGPTAVPASLWKGRIFFVHQYCFLLSASSHFYVRPRVTCQQPATHKASDVFGAFLCINVTVHRKLRQ